MLGYPYNRRVLKDINTGMVCLNIGEADPDIAGIGVSISVIREPLLLMLGYNFPTKANRSWQPLHSKP